MNRRAFLTTAGITGLALTTGYKSFAFDTAQKPYRVGLIGTGWYGKSDLFRLIQTAPVEVVSLCDVDRRMLEEAAELVSQRLGLQKKPRLYSDYRDMLREKDLDIVLIGTPDHWHALQMIAACEAGADVYVQKPISVDVAEGIAMAAAARKHGRVVQVGTQRKSTPHLVNCKKRVVEAGLPGKISHVELCCYYHMRAKGNPPVEPVPDYFDYDLWTGPAPYRQYDGLPHGRWWRAFMEYGNGIMGDMCIHMLDTVRWMMNLGWPKRISSSGGIYVQKNSKSNIADTQSAVFQYDNLNIVWTHRTWGDPPDADYPWALTLYGDKGTLKASVSKYEFTPQGEKKPAIRENVVYEREQYPEDLTEKRIELHAAPATRAHMKDFLQAIAARERPVADIEQGHISTASCILANIAMKLDRTLEWDSVNQQVVNDDEANALLQRPYRRPWVHPSETM
ncbi:Gfo/Idh/MocA family protein [candidate division KSB1 bacterium]